jgi:hypothetical protein
MPDPENQRPIQIKDLNRLTVDDRSRLYWDGKLTLSPAQSRFAVVVAIAAILGSLGTVANATVSWLTYLQRLNAPAVTPIQPVTSAPALPEKQTPVQKQ